MLSDSTTWLYLPDDCWLSIINDDRGHNYLNSLSLVSKQLLCITDGLRLLLTVNDRNFPFLGRLLKRFTNLTFLDLLYCHSDADALLHQISNFPSLNITSLKLPHLCKFPERVFSQNITTLTSLTFSVVNSDNMLLISDYFPLLIQLKLTHASIIDNYTSFIDGFYYLLSKCQCMQHLDFPPKLEVLNLSNTSVDDETLYVISKNCCVLLQLLLRNCYKNTKKGVKHVEENCTLLREICLGDFHISYKNKELFSRRGCFVY